MMEDSDRSQHDRFLRLFMEQEERLRIFVRSLLFSREEEREVMQEIAIVLWRKFDPAMDSASFVRWAFGVARMECLAFRRDRGRDRHRFGEDVFDLLSEVVLEQSQHLEEEHQALESCLQKLPSEHRSLVESAYAPGVKIEALARTLNRTPMAVYKTLHRIRLTLMECAQRVLSTAEPV
ncbi:MAG: hypothetical protein RLZZ399_1135 [Verrucomicrobiota bacterium]|jgi:RNA polymerase sigma-70 factor (ECF subfamily)